MNSPVRTALLSYRPMLLFMAWRNIWRNPVRSLLTISALAGGLVMLILYAALLEGMMRQMVQHATEVSTGHLQLHRQAFIDDQDLYATLPWPYLQRLEQQFPQLHLAPRLYAAGLASSATTATGIMIKAIDPQREVRATRMASHLRSGAFDLTLADTTATGLPRFNLVIGAQLAKNMRVAPGSELILVTQAADGSIGNALYRIAGVLRPLEPNFDRTGVLMSITAYQQLMSLQDGFHELVVRLDDIGQLEALQRALDAAIDTLTRQLPLDALGGPPLLRNWRQLTPTVADMLELSRSMVLIIGLIVMSLASMGMLNTMLMAIHERTHEFGILLAVGMQRRWLLLMVLLESLFLALLSALIGTLAGTVIVSYFAVHGIDFSHYMPDGYDWAGITFEPVMQVYLRPQHLVSACALMIAVTLIASLIPCWRTVRLKPAQVMR